MQALYTIQEVAIFMFQICGFLMGLLVIWVLVMAGAELYWDRKTTLCETCGIEEHKPIQAKKIAQEKPRDFKKEHEEAHMALIGRTAGFHAKHMFLNKNNYRKMHGMPLIRRRKNES